MDENQNPIELIESDSDPDIDLDAKLEDTLVVADLARLDGVVPRVEVHSPQQQQQGLNNFTPPDSDTARKCVPTPTPHK